MIVLRDLSLRRDGRVVLDGIDLTIAPGEVVGITGPNGAGKSTLIDVVAGTLRPSSGAVLLDERALVTTTPADRASRIAVLSQNAEPPFAFSAAEVVGMGRHPHGDAPAEERAWTRRALEAVGMTHAAGAAVEHLSGGERKRIHVARFLAQLSMGDSGRVALFDEPTEALDLRHQHLVMGFAEMLAARGLFVLVVQHDVALLAQYAKRVIVLEEGRVVADGAPSVALTPEILRAVFGVEVYVGPPPWSADERWMFVRRASPESKAR